MTVMNKPVVLAILDGWGMAPPGEGNAISQAKTPNMTRLWNEYAHTQLIAHGQSVGLPQNEAGNTETGHLNIGAGRIVYQDLPRINIAIADGTFFQNSAFEGAVEHTKQNNSDLHIMGLIGGGGVHSDTSHLLALLRFVRERGVSKVFLHLFTDGRDSPPNAAMSYISEITNLIEDEKAVQIASIAGRYYAMDRDSRWDRTAKTYFCLTRGEGKRAFTVDEAIKNAYAQNYTDEFIEPTNIVDQTGKPVALIKNNDAVIFYNFRIDRPRQLTKAFILPEFEQIANETDFDPYLVKYQHTHLTNEVKNAPFVRGPQLNNLYFVTMTQYARNIPSKIAFPPLSVDQTLGEVVANNNLKQLRISESEKERFVTYYFNGQKEDPFPNEDRHIIPSPKVSTYDKKPEMSASEIVDYVIQQIKSQVYDLIIMNFANADMVGHTGKLKATIVACQTVDECIGNIFTVVDEMNGTLVITADHGNAEEMVNQTTNLVDTEHNANPVPLIVAGKAHAGGKLLSQGILADVAPTLLAVLNLSAPATMSGRNLLRE